MLNFSRLMEMLHSCLMELCALFWRTGIIPTDWERGLVDPLWKGKGDRSDHSNYRGETLLSVPGKVYTRIIIHDGVRNHMLDEFGFTSKRSMIDRILALRVLIERRREVQQEPSGGLSVFVGCQQC